MTRNDAAFVLGIPVHAGRSEARQAMLAKLHQLIAEQGLSAESAEVIKVENAYSAFCQTQGQVNARAASSGGSSGVTSGRKSSGGFWLPVLIIAGLIAIVGLTLLVAAVTGSGSKSNGSAPVAPAVTSSAPAKSAPTSAKPARELPSLNPGVTGDVGSCWAESSPGSNQFRPVNCSSSSADVRVSRETRDPSSCSSGYFEGKGGWYLCLVFL